MEVRGKSAALYGRFSAGTREGFAAEIARRGGAVARDLTRRSDLFVVGALAFPLIDAGHLGERLAVARRRRVPVFSERRFAEALRGEEAAAPSVPVAAAASGLSQDDAEILAAFDVVRLEESRCRFADADPLRAAADLRAAGRSLGETVRILTKARDNAPKGRRKIVLDGRGRAALQWEQGLTTLDGQGFLPLDETSSLDDLFEAAAAAEADEEFDAAARFYEIAARADKKDPIACFNLGCLRLAAEAFGESALAFRQAIARDQYFTEARYNLAQVYERLEKFDLAREELAAAVALEPAYADARFNLAQLELKRGALADAKMHFERYLAGGPPPDWADKARRAIQYCKAAMSA